MARKRAGSTGRPKVEVNVVVDPTADGGVEGIVRRLRRAGLSVADVLDAVGVVSGRIAQPRLASLSHVPGVVAVEASQAVSIPPPDRDVQ